MNCGIPKIETEAGSRSRRRHIKHAISAGLTIVANAAIAKGTALVGTTRSFVLNFFFIICKDRY